MNFVVPFPSSDFPWEGFPIEGTLDIDIKPINERSGAGIGVLWSGNLTSGSTLAPAPNQTLEKRHNTFT